MDAYSDLVVKLTAGSQLRDLLEEAEVGPWQRDNESEQAANSMGGREWLAFKKPLDGPGGREATLYLLHRENTPIWYVPNIVPNGGSLSPMEYNGLLDDFARHVLGPLEVGGQVGIARSASAITLGDIYGSVAAELLREFARRANPDSPLAHPDDLDAFNRFVLAAHRRGVRDSQTMKRWLLEQSGLAWSEENVTRVVIAFDRAIALLDLQAAAA